MTVQTNTNVASFNGNGVTQIFPIAFKFNNDTDLVVLLVDDAAGTSVRLTLNSDYTVSGEGDEQGGLINVVTAPATGKRLLVSRIVDILQLLDLRNQGKFFAEVHEDAFDLLTMIAQQHESGIRSALRVAESDPEPARIPAATLRAGKLLAFDGDGNPIAVAPVADSSTAVRLELAQDDGSAKVGYKSSLPFAVSQTVKGVFDHLAVTPYTFGAAGDGVTDDTAAVKRAFEAGYALFDGVFKCTPFEVTAKKLDVHFAPGAKLVFDHQGSNSATFTSCSGHIDGIEIDDTVETVTGVFVSLLLNACTDLTINRPILNGGKDLPIAVYQSDNCHIIDGVGKGSDANRPFGWELISCKASTFTRCRLYKYQFGFMLIGPGYKSGTILPSTRAWADTLGMKAVDCYVEDHTGHAFDMNGTVGGGFSGCTAKDYTGTGGNASFQIKQSTNIPAELDDDTFINWMDDCLAVNCVNGFGTQQGTDVRLANLQVIRAKRYPVTFNSTKRVSLRGLHVRDWGLDLASWPLQNGDSICAAVAVWNGSDYCVVDDVTLSLTDAANPNIATLALCNVVGANTTVGSFRYRREVGVSGVISRAIRISGGNTLIESGFRPGDPSLYANHPVDDTTGTTMYPLEYGINVPLTSSGAFIVPQMPQRGIMVAKIAAVPTVTPGGSPQYSVGRSGSNNALLASRAAPTASEFLDPLTPTISPNLPLAIGVTAGSAGQLSVSVRGLHLL